MVKGKKSFRDRNRALTEMQLDVYCAIKNRSYIKGYELKEWEFKWLKGLNLLQYFDNKYQAK
jgi:hypothetical protein